MNKIFKVGETFHFYDEFDGQIKKGKVITVYKNGERYDVSVDDHKNTINVLQSEILKEDLVAPDTLLDELENLYQNISERAEYLEKFTYDPYIDTKGFAETLRKIIDKYFD